MFHLGAPASAFVFSQIAEWADGWMPVLAFAKDELPTQLATMAGGTEAGRDPQSIEVEIGATQV
jgi:hypothetical protein